MAPCGIEYTLQSTGCNGYLAVPLSSALICATCTAGLRTEDFREHDVIDDVDFCDGGGGVCHQCERVLAAHESNLDPNAVDEQTFLQGQVHVESSHQFDDPTRYNVRFPIPQPFVRNVDRFHVTGGIFVP